MASIPEKTIAEQDHDIIYAVGECIMAWSMVEQNLTLAYCECMNGEFQGGTSWLDAIVFDAVLSLDARLSMIDAALKQKCKNLTPAEVGEKFLERWKSLSSKIVRKYKKRHEVAHSTIIHRGKEDGKQEVLLASFPTLSKALLGYKTLRFEDIQERRKLFNELSGEIANFRAAMNVLLKLPQ